MTDPIQFSSTTPRFGIPYLHVAQAQKEFIVNEGRALADMLLHTVVEGEAETPPASPSEGECWLIGAQPAGDWTGHAREVAGFYSGTWIFAVADDGMRVFDRTSGQFLLYDGAWQKPPAPDSPSGGGMIDSEARSVITDLIEALRNAGIFSGIS